MTTSLISSIELTPDIASPEVVRGLEQCSHIWLVFVFSATTDDGWKPTVRPPRMGGKKRLGVFATRTPHRPNPIGLSPVKLEAIRIENSKVFLDVSGADLLDGTPILDIKPYLPNSDAISDADYPLQSSRERLNQPVEFSAAAENACQHWQHKLKQPLKEQIIDTLHCDPRPAYQRKNDDRGYGVMLYDLNIRWRMDAERILVESIEQADPSDF